jgi:hypothetical protein
MQNKRLNRNIGDCFGEDASQRQGGGGGKIGKNTKGIRICGLERQEKKKLSRIDRLRKMLKKERKRI